MSGLTDRLRAGENFYAESSMWRDRDLADAVDEAADEIDRLTAERDALREQVNNMANVIAQLLADNNSLQSAARAALKGEG